VIRPATGSATSSWWSTAGPRCARSSPGSEQSISAIAAQGLSFGIHVVVSTTRWAELRPALKDQIGTRIELRLGDPADSEIDRRRARLVPAGRPGRGLAPEGLDMIVALPRLDGVASNQGLAEAGVQVGEMLRRRAGGVSAAPIRLLPGHIDHGDLVRLAAGAGVLLGIEEVELRPVVIDFGRHQHLLIFGDSECGKTNALRTLCREIVRTVMPEQAQLFVVDFRRTLLGVVESEHSGGYAMSAPGVDALLPDLLSALRRRVPPARISQRQLRDRSWWSGPEIYVVVDDYDLVGDALTAIAEYLPHAGDVGLHLVVARRSGGAARAVFEPLLAGLRDLGCLTLVMSTNPDDGPPFGSVSAAPLPPGRGMLVARNGSRQIVQVAWSPPP
jgi:S-DNA-T family DNA segregation ATPase FtsK/SpoIIIE